MNIGNKLAEAFVKKFGEEALEKLKEKTPQILIGTSIAASISACVATGVGTYKSVRAVDKYKIENGMSIDDKLPKKKILKLTWKYYMPALIIEGGSIAAAASGSGVAAAAIATATGSVAELEAKNKILSGIIKEKDSAVELAESVMTPEEKKDYDNFKERQEQKANLPVETERYYVYDELHASFAPDKMSAIEIKEKIVDLNNRLFQRDFLAENDYFEEFGFDPTPTGEERGWNRICGKIDVSIRSGIKDGTLYYVIRHLNEPRRDYEYIG